MPPTPGSLRILTSSDVDTVLSTLDPELALANQADVFRAFSSSSASSGTSSSSAPSSGPSASVADIQTPQRITIASPQQTMLFMPARAGSAGGTAAKIVSVPTEGAEGLPATTVVMDEEAGVVKGLVNARKLTALRNACGSALFLRAVPPPQPLANLVIFGSGAQALSHATLFLQLYPSIASCTIIARRPSPRSASLLITLTHRFPDTTFRIGVSSYPSTAAAEAHPELAIDLSQTVSQADIIVTATSSNSPLFNGRDPKPGARIVMIGSYKPHMHEVDGELVRRATQGGGKVVVDSKADCLRESGELIDAGLKEGDLVELGTLLVPDGHDGRMTSAELVGNGDVTIFKSVGIGIQDVAIAHAVLTVAEEKGLGTVIPNYDA